MHVGVVGAMGDVGSAVVEHLQDDVEHVTTFDLAEPRELKGSVEFRQLDVTADDSSDALGDHDLDVVVNAAGPFYRLGRHALEAAVESGTPYVDVCDDHDATEEELAFDEAARDAEVPAVVGCGWTPGVSNLLARYLVEEHGEGAVASEVEVDWVGSAADAAGVAVVEHLLHTSSGDTPQYLDGEHREVRAGEMKKDVELPEVGATGVAACGHPEPLTLPRHLDCGSVVVRGGLVPHWHNRVVAAAVRFGAGSRPSMQARASRLLHTFERTGALDIGGVERSAVAVEVDGERLAAAGRMRDLTAAPAAAAAVEAAEGRVDAGVHPPEAAFSLDLVRELDGVRLYEDGVAGWQPL